MKPLDLRAFRATLDLTQKALAARLGVDRHTVKRWEMGIHPIPAMAIKLLGTMKKTRG